MRWKWAVVVIAAMTSQTSQTGQMDNDLSPAFNDDHSISHVVMVNVYNGHWQLSGSTAINRLQHWTGCCVVPQRQGCWTALPLPKGMKFMPYLGLFHTCSWTNVFSFLKIWTFVFFYKKFLNKHLTLQYSTSAKKDLWSTLLPRFNYTFDQYFTVLCSGLEHKLVNQGDT